MSSIRLKNVNMYAFQANKSSIIGKVWYHPDTRVLSVQLADRNRGKRKPLKSLRPKGYLYVGVPGPVFQKFASAKSKGKFFNQNIKDMYPSQMDVFCVANN